MLRLRNLRGVRVIAYILLTISVIWEIVGLEDIGIFHMKDRKLERFFVFEDRNLQFLAPLWVQSSFYM